MCHHLSFFACLEAKSIVECTVSDTEISGQAVHHFAETSIVDGGTRLNDWCVAGTRSRP